MPGWHWGPLYVRAGLLLLPALEALLAQQGRSIDDLGAALTLPR